MSPAPLRSVVVTVAAPGPDRASDREALLAAVMAVTDADAPALRTGRVCPHCAATDHGRPWVTLDGATVGVSLARTTGALALAVGPDPLGVDLERASRVVAAPLDVFTAAERERAAGDPRRLAACWAAKEAVLKRDGRGLRVDPLAVDVDVEREVALFDGAEHAVTLRYPGPDLVLAVAAGGVPVTLRGSGPPRRPR